MSGIFSERHGYKASERPVIYREHASPNLRTMIVHLAEKHGLSPSSIRNVLCSYLLIAPDSSNWSEYPNIDGECRNLMNGCEWFEVYDLVEQLAYRLFAEEQTGEAALKFQSDINRLFIKDGAGWQMNQFQIYARGSEPFNVMTKEAQNVLNAGGNQTAASEIHEAIRDISRRPQPDKTGAVHHAMGAIECMARSVSGDSKSTLGEIIKSKSKHHGIPSPLDDALSKMWGYASERGRHIREGLVPSFEEAELVVTVAAAVCTYLARKTA